MRGRVEAARYGNVARTFYWGVLCSHGSRIETYPVTGEAMLEDLI
jgi:hypothetical protein